MAFAVVFAVLLAACGTSSHSASPAKPLPAAGRPAGATTLVIENFSFHPSHLTVSPGATVTVRNEDSTTHTVTAVTPHGNAFDTGDISAGATATFRAPSSPGSYPYICMIHQFMTGTLTVS